jgi:hypothetical protein
LLDASFRWHDEVWLDWSRHGIAGTALPDYRAPGYAWPQRHANRLLMNDPHRLAEAVRTACIDAALRAHEDAGISGLCHEGRWEFAVQAMRGIDLDAVIRQAAETPDRGA